MSTYKTISLPKSLIESISSFIEENPEKGYTSIAEFVKDATRNLLEKYSDQHKDERNQIALVKAEE